MRDSPIAPSGESAEPHPPHAAPSSSAPPAHKTPSTLEEWAAAKGYADKFEHDPKTGQIARVFDAGAGNRAMFAAIDARRRAEARIAGRAIQERLSEQQFDDLLAQHTDPKHAHAVRFGEHVPAPVKKA